MGHEIIWFNDALAQSGGGERLSLEVVFALQRKGIQASYVTYHYDPERTFDGRYSVVAPIVLTDSRGRGFNLSGGVAARIKRLCALRSFLRGRDSPLVITSGTWSQVVDVYLATLFMSVPYVTFIYGSLFSFGPEKEPVKYARIFRKSFEKIRCSQDSYRQTVPEKAPQKGFFWRLRIEARGVVKFFAVRNSRKVFVLSSRNQWECKLLYDINAAVIQGAYPEGLLAYKPAEGVRQEVKSRYGFLFLSISRLVKNKRIDLLISAFAKMQYTDKRCALVIGGTGPDEEALKRLAVAAGVGDRVYFIGYVPEENLFDWLGCADVFVHMDLADFDIAPLEALALGATVIVADEMDVTFPRGGHPRFLKVAGNVSSLASALDRVAICGDKLAQPSMWDDGLRDLTWERFSEKMIREIGGF